MIWKSAGDRKLSIPLKYFVLIFFLGIIVNPVSVSGAPPRKALILFDGSGGNDASRVEGIQVANLLGHFGIPSYLLPVSYYEKGDIRKYHVAFFVGCDKNFKLPEAFIEDVLSYKGSFFWIGDHLEQLKAGDTEEKISMEALGKTDGVKTVIYKGYRLNKDDPVINGLKIRKGVKVLAWGERNNERLPYIVKDHNFWCVADIPFSFIEGSDRYLAFCDVLHDFLGEEHKSNHIGMVRIEDVNPTSKQEKIRDIADILNAQGVPFLISVVPYYVDPATDQEIPLSSRPGLVNALKYAVSKGGTIVMHGYTHQYRGNSTFDFEFWDVETGKPIKGDSTDFVEKRLSAGLDEFFKCRLFPLLWETPHYAASSIDYQTIARHFTTATESRIFFDQFEWNQKFPYIIQKDVYGQRVIPEYLGYVPFIQENNRQNTAAERAEADKIVDIARNMLCVRDGVGGFFFHPFVDPKILEGIVSRIKTLGYKFLDARDANNKVSMNDKTIISGKGDVKLPLKNKFLREYYIDEKGKVRREKISRSKLTTTVKRSISNHPGWLYAAEGIEEKPRSPIVAYLSQLYDRIKTSLERDDEKRTVSCAILWDDKTDKASAEGKDQDAFKKTIESLGINVNVIKSLDGLKNENLLVIPYASAVKMQDGDIKKVSGSLKNGRTLLLDGFTDLARTLNFHRAAKTNVGNIKDVFNVLEFSANGVMESVSQTQDDKIIYQSSDGFPIGLVRKEKDGGGIFFLSTLYDPVSGNGYSRFPTLINVLLDYFKFVPPVSTPRVEAYFEPGMRQNQSVEVLAKRWRKMGIRAIHVATWHFYPSYTFDYKRLIAVCHRQGISVYAWLELPYLNKTFWETHPDFREKDYKGKDVKTLWRYQLAIYDPACKKAVFAELRKLLTDFKFDGVNLAEIYFEGEGMKKPESYSPFHKTALKSFRKQYKFDMREIFSPGSKHYWKKNNDSLAKFNKFREDLVFSLHRDYIAFLTTLQKEKKGFDIVVTVLDSLISPDVREKWAVDSGRIASLLKEYPFLLVVEDPLNMWNNPPQRYIEIRKAYLNIGVPSSRLAVDLNIVDCHEGNKDFACIKQTGAELFEMLKYSSEDGNRVLVYGEGTILEQDYPYLVNAMMPPPGVKFPTLQKDVLEPIHILWTNYDLLQLNERGSEAYLEYDSPTPFYIALNKEPRGVFIDGKSEETEELVGDGEWILCLPGGKHTVKILGESRLSFDVEVLSYHEARLLFVFGIVSCGLLLSIFTINRIRRRKKNV